MELSWSDFEKVEMRVGTILTVGDFPAARNPSYQLQIDFGPLGVKKSSAQITKRYEKKQLVGKQVIAVVNFPKKQIANLMSECLVLGIVGDDSDVILLQPGANAKNGDRVG
ncbi:tRNA-binding protein [Nonlabens dokdonensis]|uniref:tRNA-binding protein n=2 Tax=Nonlabens dokdonensis TaxID=328515 RepID=A0ABX5PZN4_9FLAO|nr:tRNA-binding protein [Nonlabens dokdonensis]AGC75541.1 putative secretion chaperone contains tRNA binding domain [Nonlabens dokdonensis DSW-6]PZX43235.1 tRNA-binding protein [Nonlabens dokdonensis]